MKKNVIATIYMILVSAVIVFAQENKTIENFKGEVINGVIINGAFDIQLSEGAQTGVTIQIREDVVGKLKISITENRYVMISFSDDLTKYFQGKKKPLAKIVVSSLEKMHLSGNVSVIAKGTFSCDNAFDLEMNGGAFADFVKVYCQSAHLEFKGKSKIEGSLISAKDDIEIKATESAFPNIKVACQNIKISSGLTSRVSLAGNATKTARVHSTGTSKITMVDFTSPRITAIVSDMSRVHANITGEIDLTKAGAAAFRYIGEGKIIGEGAKPL